MSDISNQAAQRMHKSVEALHNELAKLRTGRAHPSLLDHVMVSYYGSDTQLSQVASITVLDARTLQVSPWEKQLVPAVEKAILQSDLGLNPANSGDVIRIPLPALTEERRKELIRVMKAEAEKAKVSVRNVRREANDELKAKVKDKEISEDDERRFQADVQKTTDKHVAEIDALVVEKEKDLMKI